MKMTAKEFLKQYEYADRRARHFRELYEEQQEKIDAIGSTLAGDGLPHGTGVSRKTDRGQSDQIIRGSSRMERGGAGCAHDQGRGVRYDRGHSGDRG